MNPDPEQSITEFMEFCRKRWPRQEENSTSTILISQFHFPASVYCYAYFANHLAKRTGAKIHSYTFRNENPTPLEPLFDSFGAPVGLRFAEGKHYRKVAKAEAGEKIAALKDNWDLLNLSLNGMVVGDLVYDSYLRDHNVPTVDVQDPRLHKIVTNAGVIVRMVQDYFRENNVIGVIPDHLVYMKAGIIARQAYQSRVPIYQFEFGQNFIVNRLEFDSDFPEQRSPIAWPYFRYQEWFSRLPEERKVAGLAKARQNLTERLGGVTDDRVFAGRSNFEKGSGERLLPDNGRPRILVMIHDFFDAPHIYRWQLFPDFYQWLRFVLTKSRETPFDWYVKDHPRVYTPDREGINRANDEVFAALAEEFPHATFLSSTVSNRQLLDDGIDAVFTVHGTCAHEFAFGGVKVVNCGDNPHIKYDFNIHARAIPELEHLILNADKLSLHIDRSKIEEYIYMRYFFRHEQLRTGANVMSQEFVQSPDASARMADPCVFSDFVRFASDPKIDAEVTHYFDWLIERNFEVYHPKGG